MRGRAKTIIAGLLLAVLAIGGGGATEAFGQGTVVERMGSVASEAEQVWHSDLESALMFARERYQPVLTVFKSSDCPWCVRLKNESLQDPAVESILKKFTLAEIDIHAHPETARQYRVRGVPAIFILSSDGSVRNAAAGYLPPEDLKTFLEKAFAPDALQEDDGEYGDLYDLLREGEVPAEKWPKIIMAMGEKGRRGTVRDLIFKMEQFPVVELTRLLRSDRLAVRLGALELLEQRIGDNFGFDPWLDEGSAVQNRAALKRFGDWRRGQKPGPETRYSSLTREQIDAYVRDLMTDDRQRALRAKRMLQQGGEDAAKRLSKFISETPELPEGIVMRIKEVQYAIIVPDLLNMQPAVFAHRLIYGNLDIRLQCIDALRAMNRAAMPILRDLLEDENPMVRESAVDVVASIGGLAAAETLKKHLEREKDEEVVFAILKGLGHVRSKTGLGILKEYSSHANEDLAIAAINSISRLDSKLARKELKRALGDERWRVRVAALEAVGNIEIASLTEEVAALLDDADDFVRFSAVKTIASLESGEEELKMLEQAYLADDKLKGPIIAAFGSLDKPLPKSFVPALEGKSPEILLTVLEGLRQSREHGGKMAGEYVDHPNLDVACAAIRLVASRYMKDSAMRAKIMNVLEGGENKKMLAALESINLKSESLAAGTAQDVEIDLSDIVGAELDESTNGSSTVESLELDDLFAAFEEGGEGQPEPNGGDEEAVDNEQPRQSEQMRESVDVESLLAEFDSPAAAAGSGTSSADGGSSGKVGAREIIASIKKIFQDSEDAEIRFAAALLLLKFRESAALDFLYEQIEETTADRRIKIARYLRNLDNENTVPLIEKLLNDKSESVRRAMVSSVFDLAEESPKHLDPLLGALGKNDSRLDVYDIFNTYEWQYLPTQSEVAKSKMRKRAVELLEKDDTALQNFAIIMLAKCWQKGDFDKLEKFLEAGDPYQRRAAYYALGSNEKDRFQDRLDELLEDPSEKVRLLIPFVYKKQRGWRSDNWMHYLNETNAVNDSSHHSYSSGRVAALPEKPKSALTELTKDDLPQVRLQAYLCLLSNRVSIDLNELIATVKAFPDQTSAAEKVGNFLASNHEELGPDFKVLLPYLDNSNYGESTLRKIRKHFNADDETEEKEGPQGQNLVYRHEDKRILATFRQPEPDDRSEKPSPFRMIYFTSPGCSDCARVEEMFGEMKKLFPQMRLQKFNINKVAAMRLNEALSRRYEVPPEKRLVTPAIFAAGGFLARSEISFASLGELLARSASMDALEWDEFDKKDLKQAEEEISERYVNMGLGLVVIAGLLDGVNPCAFATIIFLLSYLQVAKRRPFEIAQVGGAFILAVFLAYFALGIGLAKLIAELTLLQNLGRALTLAMAALALVVMILNIRDGVLCLRGRLADTALQLPEFLKSRIRSTIRVGARHRHFVIAAFVAGIAISFLELACTGQVYLPTILFMLNTGKDVVGAIGFLLLYNLAFVAPLLIVFGCAYFGLKSDKLTQLMNRHAAAVKFATAILFLLLFIFLVFGDSLMVLLQQ